MSKLGDLYKFQGKMSEAILHYERALTNESNSLSQNQSVQSSLGQVAGLDTAQLDGNKTGHISKIYSETFVKLFVTKGACCDWYQYDWLVEHLKYILLQQFRNGEMPCIEPFTLFMLDFSMEDKLIISKKWAQSQTK